MKNADYLPFTEAEFLEFIRWFNGSMGPAVIVTYLAGLFIIGLAALRPKGADRFISLGLSALWLWLGVAFHIRSFARLDRNAFYYGLAFALQGGLFLLYGGILNTLSFRFDTLKRTLIPSLLLIYSLMIYPLWRLFSGVGLNGVPWFGLFPCPSVVFTFSLLLLNRNYLSRILIVIPFIWSLFGLGAAVNLGVPQDYGLILTGMIGLIVIIRRNRECRRRIIETNEGIQDEVTVDDYDVMQKGFRERGILETESILKAGIDKGQVLELGPGPGYLGLEWLKNTRGTVLTGVDISPAMLKKAEENREDYGLEERAVYRRGNVQRLPLEDETMDGAFSNGSLHEWEDPAAVLDEVHRVLKPGGRLFISDLRRDLSPLIAGAMRLTTREDKMNKGLMTSIQAAYRKEELAKLLEDSPFSEYSLRRTPFGLTVKAERTLRKAQCKVANK